MQILVSISTFSNHHTTKVELHGFVGVDEIPYSDYEIRRVWKFGTRSSISHHCRHVCDLRNTSFPYGFDLKLEIDEW